MDFWRRFYELSRLQRVSFFKKGNRKKLPRVFWLLMLLMAGYLVSFVLAGFLRRAWIIVIGLIFLILFLGILFNFDKKLKSKNSEDFNNKENDRKELYKNLKLYKINRKERVVSLEKLVENTH